MYILATCSRNACIARRACSGFTLIEIMVTVAIIGILAAIALPAYTEYVRESRRADARAALSQLRIDQERFRFGCPTYAQGIPPNDGTCTVTQTTADSPDGFYSMSVAAGSADANGYTLVADPQGAQASDTACDPIQMDEDGNFIGTNADECDGK